MKECLKNQPVKFQENRKPRKARRWIWLLAILLGAFILAVEGITTIAFKRGYCEYCIPHMCWEQGDCDYGCVCLILEGYTGKCIAIK